MSASPLHPASAVDGSDTIVVVGLGAVGGSVALALRRAGRPVVGIDVQPEVASQALELGIVSEVAASVAEARLGPTSTVVVAVPPEETPGVVRAALDAGAAVVTDVASVKAPIVGAVGRSDRYVPGHPMAGTHEQGPLAARADLFEDAIWVLVETSDACPEAVAAVSGLAHAVGAHPAVLDAHTHDRICALVSHLPHLVAVLLATALESAPDPGIAARLVGPNWRGMTRVAESPAPLWVDIVRQNAGPIMAALEDFSAQLETLVALLRHGDWNGLDALLRRGASARAGALEARVSGRGSKPASPRDRAPSLDEARHAGVHQGRRAS